MDCSTDSENNLPKIPVYRDFLIPKVIKPCTSDEIRIFMKKCLENYDYMEKTSETPGWQFEVWVWNSMATLAKVFITIYKDDEGDKCVEFHRQWGDHDIARQFSYQIIKLGISQGFFDKEWLSCSIERLAIDCGENSCPATAEITDKIFMKFFNIMELPYVDFKACGCQCLISLCDEENLYQKLSENPRLFPALRNMFPKEDTSDNMDIECLTSALCLLKRLSDNVENFSKRQEFCDIVSKHRAFLSSRKHIAWNRAVNILESIQ